MTTTATRPKTSRKNTTTKRRTKTPEQRAAETKAIHDTLVAQVETLATSEGWKAYLTMATRFHSYSFGNLMLIMAQYPEATQVAGFRKWQSLGRQVRKGEKSIKILGFAQREPRKEEIESGKYKEGQKVTYFPPVSVFDISQTDVVDEEKWTTVGGTGKPAMASLEGEDEEGMGAALTAFLTGFGWEVREEDLKGGLEGYADPQKKVVAFRTGTAPAEKASTLAHEAAHVVDKHTEDMAEYRQHRGRMEAIAESTAYVIGAHFGIDTSSYSVGYVATWTKGDLELLRDTAEAVLRTSKTILSAIAPQADTEE